MTSDVAASVSVGAVNLLGMCSIRFQFSSSSVSKPVCQSHRRAGILMVSVV